MKQGYGARYRDFADHSCAWYGENDYGCRDFGTDATRAACPLPSDPCDLDTLVKAGETL